MSLSLASASRLLPHVVVLSMGPMVKMSLSLASAERLLPHVVVLSMGPMVKMSFSLASASRLPHVTTVVGLLGVSIVSVSPVVGACA